MLYKDSTGKIYRLNSEVGRGGEAVVCNVQGNSRLLAKVFSKERPEYERKLIWMRDNPPHQPPSHGGVQHVSIAWPQELLYTQNREFKGYLMQYIQGAVPLISVFNPSLRRRTLSGFNEIYLHKTARNLAAALHAVHERGYVVGDLNESNILVKPNTLITIIDTDSFQVRAKNRYGKATTYPCPVGKPEYTPPELQGKPFARTRRTPEMDRFALAVLIYQLLMDGTHPFRAHWNGSGDPPNLETRIQKGWYPYQRQGTAPISPPVNTLPLESLYPSIQYLVERTFVEGYLNPKARTSPRAWESAIAEAEQALVYCGNGHYYSTHLSQCPRCQLRQSRSQTAVPSQSLKSQPAAVPPAPASPSSNKQPGLLSMWLSYIRQKIQKKRRRLVSTPMPTFYVSLPPALRQSWQVMHDFFQHFTGKITVGIAAGFLTGGLLGTQMGGSPGGAVVGAAGGFLSGGLLSETIHKTVGWKTLGGVLGAAAGTWLAFAGSGSALTFAFAAGSGFLLGTILDKTIQQRSWIILSALLGGTAGYILGDILGTVPTQAWLGGALSGSTIGALTSIFYIIWKRYK